MIATALLFHVYSRAPMPPVQPGLENKDKTFSSKSHEDDLMNAADVLVETLMDWGVDTIFGLPGDGINGIMEALSVRQDKGRFVQVRHEESAAFMACGYAKFTGKLGVSGDLRARRHSSAEWTLRKEIALTALSDRVRELI
jgi:hypothetical protein